MRRLTSTHRGCSDDNITRASAGRGEACHLKAAGESNSGNTARAIAKIEEARRQGVAVSANMYTCTAGSTGLDATMQVWVQAGELDACVSRLQDPQQRARAIEEIRNPPAGEENLFRTAGSPDRVLFVGFKEPGLKPLAGKTLADVMKMRGTSAEDTIIDRVIADHSRADNLFPDERGHREARAVAAVGQPRIRRRSAGARRLVDEVEHASASLRQLRAPAR